VNLREHVNHGLLEAVRKHQNQNTEPMVTPIIPTVSAARRGRWVIPATASRVVGGQGCPFLRQRRHNELKKSTTGLASNAVRTTMSDPAKIPHGPERQ
jgi:hypothetical protein